MFKNHRLSTRNGDNCQKSHSVVVSISQNWKKQDLVPIKKKKLEKARQATSGPNPEDG